MPRSTKNQKKKKIVILESRQKKKYKIYIRDTYESPVYYTIDFSLENMETRRQVEQHLRCSRGKVYFTLNVKAQMG